MVASHCFFAWFHTVVGTFYSGVIVPGARLVMELIGHIGSYLKKEDLDNVRLVSKRFNYAVDVVSFSKRSCSHLVWI
jgi:hypothetical protein